jgi:hypothetical protein
MVEMGGVMPLAELTQSKGNESSLAFEGHLGHPQLPALKVFLTLILMCHNL